MTTEEQKAWDMPEKIAVMMADRLQICSPDFQHTLYHRHDLYEALKADNKILVEALQMMVDKYGGMYDDYQEADIAAKEALAQQIGGK